MRAKEILKEEGGEERAYEINGGKDREILRRSEIRDTVCERETKTGKEGRD